MLDTPYPLEGYDWYSAIRPEQCVVSTVSKGLDMAYWGFLGVGTTHGYSVSSLMDTGVFGYHHSLIFKRYSFKLQNARLLANLHQKLSSNCSCYKSPPTISEVKILKDTHCHVGGAVKIEVNNFLGMLRNVASRRDLKKFLDAKRRNLSKLLRLVAEPGRLTRPKSNKKNWDGDGDSAVKNKLKGSLYSFVPGLIHSDNGGFLMKLRI
ncbi:hypothetical protein Tco_1258295 [Tanacetum coccineum]